MDSGTCKHYHKHGFDTRQSLETYFSDKPDMVFGEDSLRFPIENVTKTFKDGHIKGDILIDLSPGSLVHYLYATCEFFKSIIVLKVQDRCILELKRWLDKRTGAFHWGHVTKMHAMIEGKSDQLQEKEEKVRSAVHHVMKCDLNKENIMDPMTLPLADCIISFGLLEFICKSEDDYNRYLRKFSELLRSGGHLILFGLLDTTYMTIGKDKMHIFKCNEDFVSKALVGAGFVIDSCKVKKRTVVSDLGDYKAMSFIAAHKKD